MNKPPRIGTVVCFALTATLVGASLLLPTASQAVSASGRLLDDGQAELVRPWGVAADEFGNVYVADTDNHRIVKFNTARQAVRTLGSIGSADGQLYYPTGIAAGGGTIYVADTQNHRIAMFSQEGAWEGSIVGEGEFAFHYPIDVDFLDGFLFVAEAGAHCRVQIINATTYKVDKKFGSCGTGEDQLRSPGGIAVTDTSIFVSDAQGGVVKKYSTSGAHLLTIGSPGSEPGQLDGPHGIAIVNTEAGGTSLWVAEAGTTSRVSQFTGGGEFVTSFNGTPRQHFAYPHGVAMSPAADLLYVTDYGADEDPTVHVFQDTNPKLTVTGDDNLKHLVRTEGIWIRMVYNQSTKTCNVLSKAAVTVPGHPRFTVEDDFKVKSLADDYKIDISTKQAKWMRQADAANKKVEIAATFKGNCQEGKKVTASESYKAG